MPDREKVMREITLCTGGGPCEGCSHYDHREDDLVGCMDELLLDALELLKEQDAKIGKWIPVTNSRGGMECNICHDYAPSYQSGAEYLSKYCPNCGAKMEGR